MRFLSSPVAIATDLGGTQLKSAVVDQKGQIHHPLIVPSDAAQGKHPVLNKLIELVSLQSQWAKEQGWQVQGAGFGIPGIYSQTQGVVYRSPHFPDWVDFPIRRHLEKKLNIPLVLDNDANFAALGERWLGRGQRYENFIFLTLGTGIGGGLIFNGRLWQGDSGFAGEIGHLVIDRQGPKCACGGRGCLELYASASGLKRILKQKKMKAVDPQIIYQQALQGHKLAIQVYQEFGQALGCGIASLVNILNVERIILGGGLSAAFQLFSNAIKTGIHRHTYPTTAQRIKVFKASLGNRAGLVGAAKAVFEL